MAEADLFSKGTRERKKENKLKENQMSRYYVLCNDNKKENQGEGSQTMPGCAL
jgi:hypothetical protein